MKLLTFLNALFVAFLLLPSTGIHAQLTGAGNGGGIANEGGGGSGDCEGLEAAAFSTVDISGESGSVLDLKGGSESGWNNQIRLWSSCKEGKLEHVIASNATSGRLVVAPGFYGGTISNVMEVHGRVVIGTQNVPDELPGEVLLDNYDLFVGGGILAEEIRVASGWADYVFYDDYKLLSLPSVKSYIQENGKLPNIPSACEIESNGLPLGDITVLQQEKIEEAFLHLIEMEERLTALEKENETLRQMLVEKEQK